MSRTLTHAKAFVKTAKKIRKYCAMPTTLFEHIKCVIKSVEEA
jgi:hypothetical protein